MTSMSMNMRHRGPGRLAAPAVLGLLFLVPASSPVAEDLSRFEVQRAHMMLNIIRKDLEKYYYDEGLHGIQPEDAFKRASERIDQACGIDPLDEVGVDRDVESLVNSRPVVQPRQELVHLP
jgi:hypothetical protein